MRAEARGLGIPEGYVDDSRRGHFINSNARAPERPVRSDIGPTQPGGRV